MKKIYLAGGCFWGVEEYFSRINGVESTTVGYANSTIEAPSYELVCTGATDAAETLMIIYDENVVSLNRLLTYYFDVIDPVSINRQGPDRGTQYRTGIYYTDESDLEIINLRFLKEQTKYDEKLAVEVMKLKNFYEAEEYHQDYLKKNPNGYCHIDLPPLKK
ncbi:MAG: peptide-methionine (S)-S-oxide reductase MsrA [Clostridia bacterium]|nr:peptide-methionine (S)-S-oxide reductase MsrA [Clostridia bacterium]